MNKLEDFKKAAHHWQIHVSALRPELVKGETFLPLNMSGVFLEYRKRFSPPYVLCWEANPSAYNNACQEQMYAKDLYAYMVL